MTSALHQMTMSFQPEDDRLLLRVGTAERKEYQLWLTRRFVRVLWSALIQVLEKEPALKRSLEPKAKQAVMAMQHRQAVDSADFTRDHDADYEDETPGTEPLLVVGGQVRPGQGGITGLVLKTQGGAEITFQLNKTLVHALCKLLIETTMKAGWDLGLSVGDAGLVVPEDRTRVH